MACVSLLRLPWLIVIYATPSRMFFTNAVLLLVVLQNFLLPCTGQTTHNVSVGFLGSFYDPAMLLTGVNDTVTFIFAGPFHTVTQSTLNAPCVPLPGGFNSGVVGRGTADPNAPTPTWSIRITNVSEPIYYFCEISTPTSHCESGMVGVINPPNNQAYMQFQSAAKAVTGTPAPSPTVVLTGIGAFATAAPFTPSPTPSSNSTSAPSPPPHTTNSHLGTIIGASVGGACGGILIIAAVTWWLVHRRTQNAEESPTSDDSHFFRYDPGPVRVRRPSEAFVAAKAIEKSMVNTSLSSNGASPPGSTNPLVPNRRASDSPPTGVAPSGGIRSKNSNQTLARQASMQSSLQTPVSSEQATNVNMQALANEVAAVLLRSPASAGNLTNSSSGMLSTAGSVPPQLFKSLGLHTDTTVDQSELTASQDHPPAYRTAATGPHSDTLRTKRP